MLIAINAVSYAPMFLCKWATLSSVNRIAHLCTARYRDLAEATFYLSAVAGHDMHNPRLLEAVLTLIIPLLLSSLLRPLSYTPLVFVPRTGVLL